MTNSHGLRRQASETLSLEQALERLPQNEQWIATILKRLTPYISIPHSTAKVLDVGCAQGRALIALAKQGYDAYGVDPWAQAIEIARDLLAQQGIEATVKAGRAEKIPFDDNFFDIVLATSVMEHVIDLTASLSEIHRVLRPGGIFWFNSASAMCPIQNEISGFPFFGWYPDPLKQRIMRWTQANRPELIGQTEAPAMHWWTPWKAQYKLTEAGFVTIWNRWELRHPDEDSGRTKYLMHLARASRLVQIVGDILIPGCSYAAYKAFN